MAPELVSSGGPFEQIYGYSRGVRVGAQEHVAGTAARGEALAGDAYVQAQNILGTIRSALEQAARGSRTRCARSCMSPTSAMQNWWDGHTGRFSATSARPALWCR
jgi:enamine deaminase RidA (YjgF/YER057c/UK114 family)